MKHKFVLAVSLALVACTLLASCGNAAADDQPALSIETDADTAPVSVEETTAEYRLETMDLEGHNFRILTRQDNSNSWKVLDVSAESENGDAINDAVYRRNLTVCESYNITIERVSVVDTNHVKTVQNSVLAGDDAYDTVQATIENQCSMLGKELLLNMTGLPYLDFTRSWWDVSAMNDICYNDKIFFALGDINIADNNATWCVAFNRVIAADYTDIPDLYQTVKDDKWTVDSLYDYAKAAASDVNGDGKMEWDQDKWGLIDQYECAPAFLVCSGYTSVVKQADGTLKYNLDDSALITAYEKVYNFISDRTFQLNIDDLSFTGKWDTAAIGNFKSSNSLFYMCPIVSCTLMRDMEDEFGMLPVPKLDEGQDVYYSTFQYNNATTYSIPKSSSEPDRTALILEALAHESAGTLTPAYYDITLKRKVGRDDESADMLDIIFSTRRFDIGQAFGASVGIYGFLQDQCRPSTFSYVSNEASKHSAITEALDKIVEVINAQ